MKKQGEYIDILAELRAHIARKYKTQKTAAAAWGCSPAFVSEVVKGKKPPTDVMLEDAEFRMIKRGPRYVKVAKKSG